MTDTDAWRASPILGVANVRRTAEYWRDVLGFSLDPDDGIFAPVPTEPEGVYGIVKRGGVWVHFQRRREASPPRAPRPAQERDIYLYVNLVHEVHADLVARGAKVVQPPTVAPYGILEFVIEDPDGHRIAFGGMLPEA
jgi:catechol 2,3-dioxygenase-like lactoylglutathione lyase family enzyme